MFFPDAIGNKNASICFGQPAWNSSQPFPIGPSAVNSPVDLWVTKAGDLFIAMAGSGARVSLFFKGGDSPTQFNLPADLVFGRPNASTTASPLLVDMTSIFFDEDLGSLWALIDPSGNTIYRWTNAIVQSNPETTLTTSVTFPAGNPSALFTAASKIFVLSSF